MTVNNDPIEIKVDNRPVEIEVNAQPVNIEVSGGRGPAGSGGGSARKIYGAKFSRSGGFVGTFNFIAETINTTGYDLTMQMSLDSMSWQLVSFSDPLIFNTHVILVNMFETPFGFNTQLIYGQYANMLNGNLQNGTFLITVEFIPIEGNLGLSNFVA